jgi:hypothetical protein
MVYGEENGTADHPFRIDSPSRRRGKYVHIRLAVLAAAVRKQRVSVLQVFGAKLIHRDHISLLEEEASIDFVAKV